MPSWVDRFEDHAVWKTLEELRAKLEAAGTPEEGDRRDTVDFVRALTERVGAYRKGSDPIGFDDATLGSVDGPLRNLVNVFTGFLDETEAFETVDRATDDVIRALAAWPSPVPEQLNAAGKKIVKDLTEATTDAVDSIGSKRDEMGEALDELKQEAARLLTKIDEAETATATQVATSEQSWSNALDEKKTEADELIEELKGLRQDALNMVHETTAATVGSEYSTYAKKSRKTALFYDALAVVFGTSGLAVAYNAIKDTNITNDVGLSLIRFGVTLGSLLIGGFLATRGNDLHKEAKAADRTAMALSRLAPFIVNLPKRARDIIVIETADRIFTKGELSDISKRDSVLKKIREDPDWQGGESDDEPETP